MNQKIKGMCFTIIGGSCWGMSGVMGKYLFDIKNMTATWLVTVRLLVAGILVLLLSYKFNGSQIFRIWKKKESVIALFIFALIGLTACQMSYFLAIQYSNPGTATVLQYSAPVFIMFFCIFVEKRIPKVIEMIVLIAVICGVFLLETHGNVHNLAITDQALFCGLFSAVAFAIYSIQPGKLMIEYGTMEITG